MTRTKEEVLEQMKEAMPFHFNEYQKPYILEAMEIHAKEEAMSFANWLSTQKINGRPTQILWNDYKDEIA